MFGKEEKGFGMDGKKKILEELIAEMKDMILEEENPNKKIEAEVSMESPDMEETEEAEGEEVEKLDDEQLKKLIEHYKNLKA
jgi:hypothetical protein